MSIYTATRGMYINIYEVVFIKSLTSIRENLTSNVNMYIA